MLPVEIVSISSKSVYAAEAVWALSEGMVLHGLTDVERLHSEI